MSLEEAVSRVALNLERHDFVEVYAHHDADGIAAGSILCTALWRKGIRFRLRIQHRVSPASLSPGMPAVLCDLGSGLEDLPEGVMVIDHHIPRFEGGLHVNPRLEGLDADRELSSAGAAYLVARELGDNRDLAGLVMLGIIGDDQELAGKNLEIFNEAMGESVITMQRGCRLAGRDLHERLLCSIDPYLPRISGDEMAVADLIETSAHEGMVEGDTLISLIVMRISPFVPSGTLSALYGDRYSLDREVIPDAHSFTAVVDACGKCGKGGLAASLCFRSAEGAAEAWDVAQSHRIRVIRSLIMVGGEEKHDGFFEVDEASVASDVADALARDTMQDRIVLVAARDKDLCYISARAPDGSGLNLGDLVHAAAVRCGGFGGGHQNRAGATIACARVGEFRDTLAKMGVA
ncbi:MAG: DHH family phosphoesterase [Methanoregulaceae archaeon]|nr:DHH family phosphoesterase [Methanoregulaceae archaeon]